MLYSLQFIYLLVGRHDHVAVLTLKDNSLGCEKYGKEPTVVFQYTQRERDELDKQLIENTASHGIVRAKVLFMDCHYCYPKAKKWSL